MGRERTESSSASASSAGRHTHTLSHTHAHALSLSLALTLFRSFLLLTYSLTRLTRRKHPFASHLPSHYLVSSLSLPSSFPTRTVYQPTQLFLLLYLDFNLYLAAILLAGAVCLAPSHRHSSQTSVFGILPKYPYTWISTLDCRRLKHQPRPWHSPRHPFAIANPGPKRLL
ncbi:hypothetical protein B0J13DRAFT_25893 [Dactylonectria estremocensis]|uniref:Uncharacterized protein n=1 Tax=Dactylonectria estremocensis TaxID=1079267 RepID=A0A9P9FIQ4_9HYPO|nr:hypothetical protein B0J13DRAFT_25893 [Dactylonectria estremocensis]